MEREVRPISAVKHLGSTALKNVTVMASHSAPAKLCQFDQLGNQTQTSCTGSKRLATELTGRLLSLFQKSYASQAYTGNWFITDQYNPCWLHFTALT